MKEALINTSEKDIIHKILDGEMALFEILIRRYNAILYKIIRHQVDVVFNTKICVMNDENI